ncbi:hypothetical protein TNIN_176631 [Trichonephila inaurata madagascariensis]|uniref:Uncharacterized protein n=1 Tax=Trichonephila inaurata madagascariensis TaxID=2747483 RepID=A0A8X7C6L4_9ARAC|nr:hypothetical protein TNIN_176631 [Trichonephila inaurata madagascariensis]
MKKEPREEGEKQEISTRYSRVIPEIALMRERNSEAEGRKISGGERNKQARGEVGNKRNQAFLFTLMSHYRMLNLWRSLEPIPGTRSSSVSRLTVVWVVKKDHSIYK